MARSRRRRGALNHPATAFAGKVAGGRGVQWESLSVSYTAQDLTVQYPTVSVTAAGFTTRYRTLIPPNVTRGPLTMLRVRGSIYTIFEQGMLAVATGTTDMVIPMSIQLVPVRDGSIVDDTVLDMRNAADLESNRILWRGNAWAAYQSNDTNGLQINVLRRYPTMIDVDVKVKRRWDRATWALIMAETFSSASEDILLQSIELRGLFQSADGV